MAGYVIAVGKKMSVADLAASGIYGTVLSVPTGYWGPHHEATFADYASMREGDRLYFFRDRRLYGIGRLKRVGADCRYQNFPGATENPQTVAPRTDSLVDPPNLDVRWVALFEPFPYLYATGVDMDDALVYRPSAFRMLRSFWGRSFIKVDDEEDQALADLVLQANRTVVTAKDPDGVIVSRHEATHTRVAATVTDDHRLDAATLVRLVRVGLTVRHEMALEAALVHQLTVDDEGTLSTFGKWDYVTHQLVASPPKPPSYNDWIDVFGLSYIQGTRTVCSYYVAELKAGVATALDVTQAMKYVDWVKDEYGFGNYGLVRAFLVAHEFDAGAVEASKSAASRLYTVGRRPPITLTWGGDLDFSLVRYRASDSGRIEFERLPYATA